ncbi:polysaccharide deacetylase family protein [Oceanihabitans sediminis]|uniref:Polysaccharide deacetylase n=1 Tax=Oceanihabitans sediminis TaxID=1812012 RepID=A0A368P3J9_9FLAO|nr:polysaccharide deacetylase family protein [Oceanihabitans sediminis]MDX1277185.1 polysaccharide deacetylase family protein [Oceanihabitans sediminis]MDX1773603.1 polysaccharide deacetylase family protein [Oceanihabitans sediminis]RBP33047.1 polysaccharide deacetylase [Oceanihabitans sediminis]RCU57437.1 polysaccharide deacetylase [Oceanihabitans sediminis]
MKLSQGHLVISLDFELYWGVFDVRSLEDYKSNIEKVSEIIPRLLKLSDRYNIKLTFATVGFLLAKNKEELIAYSPNSKPSYSKKNFSSYRLIEHIGNNEKEDPYHYATSLVSLIKQNPNHEIGSHTFSHYYCNEVGQTPEQFEADLLANIAIAKQQHGLSIKSIAFPRNQINDDCLKICYKHGLTSYRGIEKHWMYDTHNTEKLENLKHRVYRLLDAYMNISGHNTNDLQTHHGLVNIASSRFLRSYSKKLSFLEATKILRIKKGMTHAAKKKQVYHLWWHPHNFGENTEENFKSLEEIFLHYSMLSHTYNFTSKTMTNLAELFSKEGND